MVDRLDGLAAVAGWRVGGGDDLVAGLDADGAVAACGLDPGRDRRPWTHAVMAAVAPDAVLTVRTCGADPLYGHRLVHNFSSLAQQTRSSAHCEQDQITEVSEVRSEHDLAAATAAHKTLRSKIHATSCARGAAGPAAPGRRLLLLLAVRSGSSDKEMADEFAAANLCILATRTRCCRNPYGEGFGLILIEGHRSLGHRSSRQCTVVPMKHLSMEQLPWLPRMSKRRRRIFSPSYCEIRRAWHRWEMCAQNGRANSSLPRFTRREWSQSSSSSSWHCSLSWHLAHSRWQCGRGRMGPHDFAPCREYRAP
jgi:hypothetical protein